MPSLNPPPKSPYKFRSYIMGPRMNRVHLDAGDPPTLDPSTDDQNSYLPDVSLPPVDAPVDPEIAARRQRIAKIFTPGGASIRTPPFVAPSNDDSNLNPEYTSAVQQQEELLRNKPERPQPHWWQNAIAGALGGLAGWTNAARRTRPIDVTQATENILHPGYGAKLQDWQSKIDALKGITGLEAERQAAQEAQERIAAQAESRKAIAAEKLAKADPHYNKVPLDAAYVKEHFPWYSTHAPDANGDIWVDKSDAAKLKPFEAPEKPPSGRAAASPQERVAAAAAGIDLDDLSNVTPDQAAKFFDRLQKAGAPARETEVTLAVKAANGDKTAQDALDRLAKKSLKSKLPRAAKAKSIFDISDIGAPITPNVPLPQGNGRTPDLATVATFRRRANGDKAATYDLLIQHGWKP